MLQRGPDDREPVAGICALVPTFDNPRTVRGVVERIRAHGLPVVLVDDGSGSEARDVCRRLAAEGVAELVRLDENRGKSEACRRGFERARELGFTHAFQIDADAQHDLDAVPGFVAASAEHPDAVVLGYPVYDDTAPVSRRIARWITAFWVGVEVGGFGKIKDALIGFRVYPIEATLALPSLGHRMSFDPEVAVRLVRAGTPAINRPVHVRYPTADEGGVSHFSPLRDNLGFARMHSRLCLEGCLGALRRGLGRGGRRANG